MYAFWIIVLFIYGVFALIGVGSLIAEDSWGAAMVAVVLNCMMIYGTAQYVIIKYEEPQTHTVAPTCSERYRTLIQECDMEVGQ